MTDPARAALRAAMAASGTALVVAAAHVPQPFLAVLAAQLTAGIADSSKAGFLKRLASACGGILLGLGLLVALPDQPYLSLPAFGILTGVLPAAIARRFGLAEAILFSMGFCGMFAAGIVYPAAGIVIGTAHAASLAAAVVMTFFAQRIFPIVPAPAPPLAASGWVLGTSAVGAILAACTAFSDLSVIATIAALATVLSLPPGTGGVAQKLLGGLLGVVVSYVFLIFVSGAADNLALFLSGLAIVIGGFEWATARQPARSILFRQAGALFAVAATILPRPEASLSAPTERLLAVLLGLTVATLFHLAFSGVPGKTQSPGHSSR